MKKKELIPLYNHLISLSSIGGARFAYAISKNKKLIKDEMDTLSEVLEGSPKFKEYEKKRVEICIKYAEKDSEGKPVFKGYEFVIVPENLDTLKAEIATLQREYSKELEEQQEKINEYDKLLDEEIDPGMEFKTIKREILPEEITSAQLDPIMFLIVE